MDESTIANELATHLRGLDVIAHADADPENPNVVNVRTQGGVAYLVSVVALPITTESAAAE